MAELIDRVRRLVGDPAGPEQTFTDDEIQEALDRHQTTVRYAPLLPVPTMLPDGGVEYRDYYAGVGDWEANEQLVDASWRPLTPQTSDRLVGRWEFAAPGQPPPVYIVGRTYDIFAAAADLLEAWAAREKAEFDFSADGQTFQRSQKIVGLLRVAGQYRRRQRPAVITQARSDIDGG